MDALQQRIVLVTRRTRLEDLVARLNTVEQARFYVEHLGADFSDYEAEQATYQQAVATAEATLARFARVQRLDRSLVPNFLFPPDCLVVVIGQDGLVANTLKYLDGQPVIGVNPDPKRWDGVLLPFKVQDLRRIVPEAQAGRRPTRAIRMARATLSDGQQLHAVNDLFIDRDAQRSRIAVVPLESRRSAELPGQGVGEDVELAGLDARTHPGPKLGQDPGDDPAAPPHDLELVARLEDDHRAVCSFPAPASARSRIVRTWAKVSSMVPLPATRCRMPLPA